MKKQDKIENYLDYFYRIIKNADNDIIAIIDEHGNYVMGQISGIPLQLDDIVSKFNLASFELSNAEVDAIFAHQYSQMVYNELVDRVKNEDLIITPAVVADYVMKAIYATIEN